MVRLYDTAIVESVRVVEMVFPVTRRDLEETSSSLLSIWGFPIFRLGNCHLSFCSLIWIAAL
jgi:hypothetical protein